MTAPGDSRPLVDSPYGMYIHTYIPSTDKTGSRDLGASCVGVVGQERLHGLLGITKGYGANTRQHLQHPTIQGTFVNEK